MGRDGYRRSRRKTSVGSLNNVFVAYLHPDEIPHSFAKSLVDLRLHDAVGSNHIANWGNVRSSGYGIPEARNEIAAHTLSNEQFEWLLFVDGDMGFNPDALDKLMEAADPETRRVVGGLCFAYKDQGWDQLNGIRHQPLPTIYDFADGDYRGRTHYPVNAVIPSAATGMAMCLIHRSVLQEIADEHGPSWFDRIPKPKTKVGDGPLGEDISFFVRCAGIGVFPLIHTGVKTSHYKRIYVQEADFWTSFHAPPATVPVDVIIPTVKERVGNLTRLLQSLKATTGLATPIVVVDDQEHADAVADIDPDATTLILGGRFPTKLNYGYAHSTADWVQFVGDDVTFYPDWLNHQQHVARLYDAKVVGSNDLANARVLAGEHATHWMVARDYIEESGASWDGPGSFAHEGYKHWFVDDEIVAKAKQAGVFQMALGAVIEHHHPIVGAPSDEVYERNDKHAERDHIHFKNRVKKYT